MQYNSVLLWQNLGKCGLIFITLLIEKQKVNDPNPLYELAQDVALRN